MKINNDVIQQANNVLKQAILTRKSREVLINTIKNKKPIPFFVTVKSVELMKFRNKVMPVVIFDKLQCSNYIYHILLITKYSTKFAHLKQLKKGDKLQITARICKANKGCLNDGLIIFDIQSTEYVSYPEDYILRRLVPKDKEIRLGYTLVMIYPPMTLSTGQIELNYPPYERKAILKYLEWLKRK